MMRQADLAECRKKLDDIDAKIASLFEERMEISGEVAACKRESGKPVYDPGREKEKIASMQGMMKNDFNRQAIKEIFLQLMTIGRRYQYGLLKDTGKTWDSGLKEVENLKVSGARVVYQGVEGAYSHAAVLKYFGENADCYHVPRFEDTMEELRAGRAGFAVLPIENSTAGFVNSNYDLLAEYDHYIVGETYVPVDHMLLGVPGSGIEDIKTVYSHPQGLMQCSAYLNAHRDWQQVSVPNTAVAAKKVVDEMEKSQAAVASRTAGKIYGLVELAQEINDVKGNTTRFMVLTAEPVYAKRARKVSVMFEVPHVSGSLYNTLGNFIYNGINVSMIESRPIHDRPFEYRFFMDFEGNLSDAAVQNALYGLKEETETLKILGNY